MPYNWQSPGWPKFQYDLTGSESLLLDFADRAGQTSGILKSLPENAQSEAVIDLMIAEAVKTSEIEGEYVSRADVKSSIRNQLGLNSTPDPVRDPLAKGVAELMVRVRSSWKEPLTTEMLFAWHGMLLGQKTGMGRWREHPSPMQVVSGPIGNLKVHFEAPPSTRVPSEMEGFIKWFNASESEIPQAPVRSAIAHLYFESVHPFEDGNGRIGRALSEKVLSQGLKRPALLSLSRTIEAAKPAYYQALERAQKSTDATDWVRYFIGMVRDSQEAAERQIEFVLRKARFFDLHKHHLNERQTKVLRRMLEEGPDGFEGGMTTRKYVALTKASKATATRDLQELAQFGAFSAKGEGRGARYELNL